MRGSLRAGSGVYRGCFRESVCEVVSGPTRSQPKSVRLIWRRCKQLSDRGRQERVNRRAAEERAEKENEPEQWRGEKLAPIASDEHIHCTNI